MTRPDLVRCDQSLVGKTIYLSYRDRDDLGRRFVVSEVNERAQCATIRIPGHEAEWSGTVWREDIHLTLRDAAIARVCDAEEHLASCIHDLEALDAEASNTGPG